MSTEEAPQQDRTPSKVFALRLSLIAFAIAMGLMYMNAGWLLHTKNPYPHSAMASAYAVFVITLVYLPVGAFIPLALLIDKAWKYAAIATLLLCIALIPALLLLNE